MFAKVASGDVPMHTQPGMHMSCNQEIASCKQRCCQQAAISLSARATGQVLQAYNVFSHASSCLFQGVPLYQICTATYAVCKAGQQPDAGRSQLVAPSDRARSGAAAAGAHCGGAQDQAVVRAANCTARAAPCSICKHRGHLAVSARAPPRGQVSILQNDQIRGAAPHRRASASEVKRPEMKRASKRADFAVANSDVQQSLQSTACQRGSRRACGHAGHARAGVVTATRSLCNAGRMLV